jgi:hypothetical protein
VKLVSSARPLTADEAILRPTAMELASVLNLLEVLSRHVAAHDQQIARAFAAHPKAGIFASLPGADPVLAPRLLTLFGERLERYPDAASVQNMPGWRRCPNAARAGCGCTGCWAAPKFLRQTLVGVGGADRAALHVGQGILPAPKDCREGPPRHPSRPRLQVGAHPVALLKRQRALRRRPLPRHPPKRRSPLATAA